MIHYSVYTLLLATTIACSWQHKDEKAKKDQPIDAAAGKAAQQLEKQRETTTFSCQGLLFKSGDSCQKYEELKKCLRDLTQKHCPADQKITEVHCKGTDTNCKGTPQTVLCTIPCPQVNQMPKIFDGDITHEEESLAFIKAGGDIKEIDANNEVCKVEVPSGYYTCGKEKKPKEEVIEHSPINVKAEDAQEKTSHRLRIEESTQHIPLRIHL
jgi:hypothetical protein